MKIIKSNLVKGSEFDVKFTGGNSLRLLTSKDKMGFGICETHVPKGGPHHWHYKNHLEACYCISGNGILTNLDNGEIFSINPGTTYALDLHDNHTFEALNDVVLISIFNPPLTGKESHDAEGNYN